MLIKKYHNNVLSNNINKYKRINYFKNIDDENYNNLENLLIPINKKIKQSLIIKIIIINM